MQSCSLHGTCCTTTTPKLCNDSKGDEHRKKNDITKGISPLHGVEEKSGAKKIYASLALAALHAILAMSSI